MSAAGWLNMETSVSRDISFALEFISATFSIRIGTKSLIALLIIAGDTSGPQIGGARLVPKILSPS